MAIGTPELALIRTNPPEHFLKLGRSPSVSTLKMWEIVEIGSNRTQRSYDVRGRKESETDRQLMAFFRPTIDLKSDQYAEVLMWRSQLL